MSFFIAFVVLFFLMKVLLYGKFASDIKTLVENTGFDIVTEDPDVIICYGGDGTLLSAERNFPSIPKLPIRNSKVCIKCLNHDEKKLLEKLKTGKLKLKQHLKIEASFSGETVMAINDIVIRNKEAIHAIRFEILNTNLEINGRLIIGDGIVVSTPFGSTGYFKSITRKTFKNGFAIAFNNCTDDIKPVFFSEKDKFKFKLIRGLASLTFDNGHSITQVPEGEDVSFKIARKGANIYELESLRCSDCKRTLR